MFSLNNPTSHHLLLFAKKMCISIYMYFYYCISYTDWTSQIWNPKFEMPQNPKLLSADMAPEVEKFTPDLIWWVVVKMREHNTVYSASPREKKLTKRNKTPSQPTSALIYFFLSKHDGDARQPQIVHTGGWASDTFLFWWSSVHKRYAPNY